MDLVWGAGMHISKYRFFIRPFARSFYPHAVCVFDICIGCSIVCTGNDRHVPVQDLQPSQKPPFILGQKGVPIARSPSAERNLQDRHNIHALVAVLSALGMIGMYLSRISNQVKSRPLYWVKKVYQLPDSHQPKSI